MVKEMHKLDLAEIDELDEIDGDQQLKLIWCETHQKYEWHWLPRDTRNGGYWETTEPEAM
jgi:hypothetical protein